ncbi:class I SAM-dependent methyltransferase [Alkalibacillus haloalkaliphilus]|uniref:class I SAM-dependent methyltransferase n=1 Tax=Alkalibacillus haloalkaliphilus TaxID=94136 RepID=UPI0029363D4C|nr:class I SAM-dependent methyltransferase [Alkalibacillus haloalkaliphilus]MDV2582373.1 class I SAM-dependent methyltransferase [Alkalibacillus haloalkaliphilus]
MNNQSIVESYNQKAVERNSSSLQEWKVKEREKFLEYLLTEGCKSLLEIGAGPGKDSLYFKEQGLNTISTDISPEMIKLCKKKGLDAEVMSFANLDYPDHYFDSIWALNCLLHVSRKEIKGVLAEIKRVLKPSGLLYIGVYGGRNQEGVWKDDHYNPKRFFSFYDDESIKQLLAEFFIIENFEVVPKETVGGDFHFQSVVLRK